MKKQGGGLMKITGIVKSAEEITGIKGIKSFEGVRGGEYINYTDEGVRGSEYFNYTEIMNNMAGQKIVLEEYKGSSGYDYIEIRDSAQTACWQTCWLKDIQTEVDWSKVPVDAKVIVNKTTKRHFAKFENGIVYTWDLRATSWSALNGHSTLSWSPEEVELVE